MESKKINQLATSVAPQTSDLTIIGDPITGVSKKITLLQIANLFATTGTVSSVAVTETGDALTITGSPITSAGTINIGFAGDATQYVRGDGALADFPTSTGGGSSVSYYLNSSVSQGTIGGVAYRELSKDPISGAGTDITISANGYIASYITDANDPALLEVPGGNFNCEFYFSVNSNAHNPYVYAELYKYDGTTFTLLGSSQSVPEYLTNGTTLSPYYFAIPVATAALTITDRLAIRIYANVDTRTVTLHTENNHLCQVVTTFSKGLTSLNNLTRQVQFLATGTSGTDFGIVSSVATHTFNLPIASAANTGKLSSTDWSTFNAKQPAGNYVTLDTTQTITAAKTFSLDILVNSLTIGRGTGAIATNTVVGSGALAVNTTGNENTAIGNNSLAANTTGLQNTSIGRNTLASNTTGFGNFAAGSGALFGNTTGGLNIAIGSAALTNNTTANYNIGIGAFAGNFTTGSYNIAIGTQAGSLITTGSNNTIIGAFNGTAAMSNNIVLADGAGNVRYQWDGTNNVFGNPISGTSATFTSSVTASSLVKSGGTSSQFLMADGSVNTSVLPSGAYLPLTGGTLTGALSGTSATFTNASGAFIAVTATTTDATGSARLRVTSTGSNINDFSSFSASHPSRANQAWIGGDGSSLTTVLQAGGVEFLRGTSTGAATFSSTIAATSANFTGNLVAYGSLVIGNQGVAGNYTISVTPSTTSPISLQGILAGTGTSPIIFQPSGDNVGIGKTGTIVGLDVYFLNTDCINARTNAAAGNARSLYTGWYSASATSQGQLAINVTSNGNITNLNNSYGSLSDIKLKENIVDASPKLDDLLKVRVVNYNLIGQESKQIGVIAQELEQVFPSMIEEYFDKDENGENLETMSKGVKYSVFVPILIKAIQEQQAQIDELKAKILSL
jgi:hypothetical protein